MMITDVLEPATSDADYYAKIVELSKNPAATTFKLRCQLPTQGRSDMIVAATPLMNIVLKAYAAGGENTLHAHQNEDHAFISLQGFATFYGAGDKVIARIGKNEGIMIPKGALYRFEAGTDEPLVLLRVGANYPGTTHVGSRKSADGSLNESFSAKNKQVDLVLSDKIWG
jgi:mannose-6-phosphate isomerase-like protein (cupin superfamily)